MKKRLPSFVECLGLWLFAMAFLFAVGTVNATNLLPSSNLLKGYQGEMIPNVLATISASGTTTGIINLHGFTLTGILLPTTFTSTTLTFLVSVDGTNFYPLKTTASGTSLSYTVAQGTYAALNPVDFYGVHYLEIVGGSTEGSARTLTLALKGI